MAKKFEKYAANENNPKWQNMIKREKELYSHNNEMRTEFERDYTRIVHCNAYRRLKHKTQVFFSPNNDHICTRIEHVTHVESISYTIAKYLGLNVELTKAIATAHDIGHSPFGHKGETYLNNLSQREKVGHFYHNAQSVRVLKDLENLNISVQTLDGILAHNGEILINKYEYNSNKTKEEFLQELHDVFYKKDYSKKILPMTLEGAVVRLSDIIAYIGRDIEDSIKVGVITREDIPQSITNVLGDNNSKIVDTLIKDIIINSMGKPYLTFSDDVFSALLELMDWNYKYIYASKEANKHQEIVKVLFDELFDCYLEKAKKVENLNTSLSQSDKNFYEFLKEHSEKNKLERIIIDYMSGQTDKYFLKECEENIKGFNMEELYRN